MGAFAAHVMKVRDMMVYLHGFSSINRLTIKHSTSKRTNIPCLFDHKSITSLFHHPSQTYFGVLDESSRRAASDDSYSVNPFYGSPSMVKMGRRVKMDPVR